MCRSLNFIPFPLFKGAHSQTVMGSLLNWQRDPGSEQMLVRLPDEDQISLEISVPEAWGSTDPTVVMLHGLAGSHYSPHLIRMTNKLLATGIKVVRMNMRGCGSGKGLARHIYHSGRSDDVLHSLRALQEKSPDSPTVLVGFSLGGNIALKLAGELKSSTSEVFKKVIAINPPVDLYSSVDLLSYQSNRIYERYFIRLLRADVIYRHKIFPDLPKVDLPKKMSFFDFDELYTAPQCGFSGAMDYYEKCSSAPLIADITIACNILFAEDDPIICANVLDGLTMPDNVSIYKTEKGGHIGYLGYPSQGFHWLDKILISWIQDI